MRHNGRPSPWRLQMNNQHSLVEEQRVGNRVQLQRDDGKRTHKRPLLTFITKKKRRNNQTQTHKKKTSALLGTNIEQQTRPYWTPHQHTCVTPHTQNRKLPYYDMTTATRQSIIHYDTLCSTQNRCFFPGMPKELRIGQGLRRGLLLTNSHRGCRTSTSVLALCCEQNLPSVSPSGAKHGCREHDGSYRVNE